MVNNKTLDVIDAIGEVVGVIQNNKKAIKEIKEWVSDHHGITGEELNVF